MASYMPLGPGSGFDVGMPVTTESGAALDQQCYESTTRVARLERLQFSGVRLFVF
jgi:hypothetical protein